ncbi:hypothetical protein JL721_9169 [Aureococcus anophagefferens]|nr:hypothetical protein JL721_9169 [Aureococcus anophagefferens]
MGCRFFVMMVSRCAPLLVAASAGAAPPDLWLVVADDLGYNEMNFMNATRGIETPFLDALAADGVVLTQYYSNVIYWDTPWSVPLEHAFVSERLQAAGYDTALFGKWHLGMHADAFTPLSRGFGTHVGYYQGCESAFTHVAACRAVCCEAGSPDADDNFTCAGRYAGYDWFEDGVPAPAANRTKSSDVLAASASAFLAARTTTPDFLEVAFQNVHGPYTTTPAFRAKYAAKKLSDAERTLFGYITEMDAAVGAIVDAAKSFDAARFDDAVVVFTSDNGAPAFGKDSVDHTRDGDYIARNHPFRGVKSFLWEGGTRVAAFVSSRNRVPAARRGARSDGLFHVTDWHPTLVALATGHAPAGLDGFDVWDAVALGAPSPRTEVLRLSPLCDAGQAKAPKAALRVGELKLLAFCYAVAGVDGAAASGPSAGPGMPADFSPDGLAVYNLTADPSETTNVVAALDAPLLANLLGRLAHFADASVPPMQWDPPYQGDDACGARARSTRRAPASRRPGCPGSKVAMRVADGAYAGTSRDARQRRGPPIVAPSRGRGAPGG